MSTFGLSTAFKNFLSVDSFISHILYYVLTWKLFYVFYKLINYQIDLKKKQPRLEWHKIEVIHYSRWRRRKQC